MDMNPFRVAPLLLLLLNSNAQEAGTPRKTTLPDPKIFEGYERQLAQTFETIRRESRLTKLSRINRRQKLDQLVCTAALIDVNPYGRNAPASLMYKTSEPTSVSEELKSIAMYDQPETPPNSRYALAIWPGTDAATGARVYWVGVEICVSAFFEFIDNTFTDNRPYRNDWKALVDPSCRKVR